MAAEQFLPPGKLETLSVVDTTWQQELVSADVMSLLAKKSQKSEEEKGGDSVPSMGAKESGWPSNKMRPADAVGRADCAGKIRAATSPPPPYEREEAG